MIYTPGHFDERDKALGRGPLPSVKELKAAFKKKHIARAPFCTRGNRLRQRGEWLKPARMRYYVSKKKEGGEVHHYSGRYGQGFMLLEHLTTMFCTVTYFVYPETAHFKPIKREPRAKKKRPAVFKQLTLAECEKEFEYER